MRTTEADGDARVVVGLLYPPEWYGDAAGFAREIEALEGLDPRVAVLAESYSEPHELRSARGKPDAEPGREEAPPLTDAQREVLGRVEVVVAIDLPYDVATYAPNLRWVQAVMGASGGQVVAIRG